MFKVIDNNEVVYGNLHTRAAAIEYIQECMQEDRLESDSHLHNYTIEEYGINVGYV